jgi:hypothetical protein
LVHAIALPRVKAIAKIWHKVARTHSGPSILQPPAAIAENYVDKAHDGVEGIEPAPGILAGIPGYPMYHCGLASTPSKKCAKAAQIHS